MDKVILITGASSGIGEGIARELGTTGRRFYWAHAELSVSKPLQPKSAAQEELLKRGSWMSQTDSPWQISCK